MRPGSRLLELTPGAGPQALLDLATEVEVADLIALRDSAVEVFVPHLPPGPVIAGPTFDGSRLLPADADLIAGDCLIECKATIGGPPRKDGTRAFKFDRNDLFQVLGYALMDFSDTYAIRPIGLYAPRFASFQTWPLAQILDEPQASPWTSPGPAASSSRCCAPTSHRFLPRPSTSPDRVAVQCNANLEHARLALFELAALGSLAAPCLAPARS
ncbi:hypothetical protein [Glycomyces harbinensis]|uniref:Uncharacterized protein n=1 Tax=Glycomyces harbinensis TaxID=58114 RepID=A0A1G6YAT9_9ACTN|nr:hypothetical protein [Glycomyces harbinensis]SDD87371.1 hypothetical protein SAMN05216270_108227 [Glycomyces harbinensis]